MENLKSLLNVKSLNKKYKPKYGKAYEKFFIGLKDNDLYIIGFYKVNEESEEFDYLEKI